VFEMGLRDELKFLLKLQNDLGEHISIEKTPDKYDSLDYIIRRDDKIMLYIEIKHRYIELDGFDSFMIGRVKIERISLVENNSILVWVDTNSNKVYFKHYTKDLLDLKTYFERNSQKMVSYIHKSLCSVGYEELLVEIQSLCSIIS